MPSLWGLLHIFFSILGVIFENLKSEFMTRIANILSLRNLDYLGKVIT